METEWMKGRAEKEYGHGGADNKTPNNQDLGRGSWRSSAQAEDMGYKSSGCGSYVVQVPSGVRNVGFR